MHNAWGKQTIAWRPFIRNNITVCLDREVNGPHFHYVKQTSPPRWNHHVVVKSLDQIESPWFKDLVKAGYDFANK
ncbi:hypothetical protein EHI45_30605 [Rhizobium leguminosarum]|uniref:DUF5655 domain-containing protein n=1 Tax=Rhizobium leguminosarum TaxID=384 RepID=UPI000FEC4E1A|nr:DUF5655 domain-containing protein [Rhizobium leguminosarum]RWX05150.1 hypothetical protein EHI45_30605 [Rhizobium leguminosarum]